MIQVIEVNTLLMHEYNDKLFKNIFRSESRTAATSKGELFVTLVKGWKLLIIITKSSTLDFTAVLDLPLILGFFFDENLSLLENIDVKIKKATLGVNLIRQLNPLLPSSSLLTVFKCFIRPYLGYGDVAYDHPNLSFLTNKIESAQYNAAVSITGYRGTTGLLPDYQRNFYF